VVSGSIVVVLGATVVEDVATSTAAVVVGAVAEFLFEPLTATMPPITSAVTSPPAARPRRDRPETAEGPNVISRVSIGLSVSSPSISTGEADVPHEGQKRAFDGIGARHATHPELDERPTLERYRPKALTRSRADGKRFGVHLAGTNRNHDRRFEARPPSRNTVGPRKDQPAPIG
jgi:hypothetical protein